MSHFTTVATRIVSADHLVRALADLGFVDVEVHAQAQPLIGWIGDPRTTKAHVIVRKRHLDFGSNDLGFFQNAQGTFDALISDFDRAKYDDRWLNQLTQRYAYHVACDLLEQQRFSKVEERREKDGSIRLTLRRMT